MSAASSDCPGVAHYILMNSETMPQNKLRPPPSKSLMAHKWYSHLSWSITCPADIMSFNCTLQCTGYQCDTEHVPRTQSRTTVCYLSLCGAQFVARTTSLIAAYGKCYARHSDCACVSSQKRFPKFTEDLWSTAFLCSENINTNLCKTSILVILAYKIPIYNNNTV
jgi:hypothetical protein